MKWKNLDKHPIEDEGLYIFLYQDKLNILINMTIITNKSIKHIRKELHIDKLYEEDPRTKMFEWHPVFIETPDEKEIFYLKIPICEIHHKYIEFEKDIYINADKRLTIFRRDNYKCVICDNSPAMDNNIELTIDHIYPLSLGGSSHINNLQTL